MSYKSCPNCNWLTNIDETDFCDYCGYSFSGVDNAYLFNPYLYQADYVEELEQIDKNRIILMYVKIIEVIKGMEDIVENNRNNTYYNLEENEDFSWWKERLVDDIKERVMDMLNEVNDYLRGMIAKGKCEKIPLYIFDNEIKTFASDVYEPLIDFCNEKVRQINYDVEMEYTREVRDNSQMGFGVITNSFIGAALYALQSSSKEAKAEIKASENRAISKSRKISQLAGDATIFWREEFDLIFKNLFIMLQSMMIEELGEIILGNSGYTWDDVLEWIQSL